MIRDYSIDFGKRSSKQNNYRQNELEYNLRIAQNKLANDQSSTNLNKVNSLQLEYDLYVNSIARGAQLRAKEKWIEEGEKKY